MSSELTAVQGAKAVASVSFEEKKLGGKKVIVPELAAAVAAEESQLSLGFNASVTDLLPAENEVPVDIRKKEGAVVELRAETPP